jgi:hypothetical protein
MKVFAAEDPAAAMSTTGTTYLTTNLINSDPFEEVYIHELQERKGRSSP